MNVPETYDYLVRARRDLWAALEGAPDEVLSRPLLGGPRFGCIKDLVFHVAAVEDRWIHLAIVGDRTVLETLPALKDAHDDAPVHAGAVLGTLLDFWRAVEGSTLAYLAGLTDDETGRVVTLDDDGTERRFPVDGLLWHVMTHEMRHTAQIAVLLRTQGIEPPSLDLLFYLRPA